MVTDRPLPEVLSLIVCDQIITDRITGKQSLIGMFARVHARKFPVAHPLLSVFASLTEGYGQVELTIRVVDANDARPPIVEGRGKVEFKDPRAIAHLALQFHGLVFPERGEYRVQLVCDGQLLREARLDVIEVRPKSEQPPGSSDYPEPPDFNAPPEQLS